MPWLQNRGPRDIQLAKNNTNKVKSGSQHTMVAAMPSELSRRTKNAANNRIMIVTGIAAIVRANSTSVFVTITMN